MHTMARILGAAAMLSPGTVPAALAQDDPTGSAGWRDTPFECPMPVVGLAPGPALRRAPMGRPVPPPGPPSRSRTIPREMLVLRDFPMPILREGCFNPLALKLETPADTTIRIPRDWLKPRDFRLLEEPRPARPEEAPEPEETPEPEEAPEPEETPEPEDGP